MITDNRVMELLQNLLTLVGVHLIDILGKRADGEDTLPASDGVRAYNRMHGRELLAHVLRRAASVNVQRGAAGVGGLDEPIAHERRRQALEELLHGLAEALVDLVPGGPERVAAGLGQLDEPQARVVGRDWLELDVAVPLCGVVAALVLLVRDGEQFPAAHG